MIDADLVERLSALARGDTPVGEQPGRNVEIGNITKDQSKCAQALSWLTQSAERKSAVPFHIDPAALPLMP